MSYQIACNRLSSVVSIVITKIDIIKISISKIEKFIWIINGESVGPIDFIVNNHCSHFAIHAGFFNSRVLAPVSPEHYMSTEKITSGYQSEKNLAPYWETLHKDSLAKKIETTFLRKVLHNDAVIIHFSNMLTQDITIISVAKILLMLLLLFLFVNNSSIKKLLLSLFFSIDYKLIFRLLNNNLIWVCPFTGMHW